MRPDITLLKTAMACKCPKCGKGDLYASPLDMQVREQCPVCGLDLAKNDTADGPAVFLIFILGFLLVPMALLFDYLFSPPLWTHVILWGVIGLGATVASLKPVKSYILALQYKHMPWDRS